MKTTTLIIVAAVALLIGLWGGYVWGGNAVSASYATKIARVEAIVPPFPTSTESLSGVVQAVNGTTLTLQVAPGTLYNPFTTDFPMVRQVTITDATAVTQLAPVSPAVVQQELAAYSRAPSGPPPQPFAENPASASDIAAGDSVTVTAASNIMSASSFPATAIQIVATAPAASATATTTQP